MESGRKIEKGKNLALGTCTGRIGRDLFIRFMSICIFYFDLRKMSIMKAIVFAKIQQGIYITGSQCLTFS